MNQNKPLLVGDRAKEKLSDDEFSLEKIAESLATVLKSGVVADGYTIGIEGGWGSGKTSLVNFVSEQIAKDGTWNHGIIHFKPWLVGSKEALLEAFFDLLILEIRRFGGDPRVAKRLQSNPSILKRITGSLSKYAKALKQGGSLVDAGAAFDPTGAAKGFGWLLRLLGTIAGWISGPSLSLDQLKEHVRADLKTLEGLIPGLRFTVVIDDLDRLEPAESVEILRLVKAAADFPLVTYFVCFDRELLAKQVQKVIGVGDGYDYIEKIFQNLIPLPPQEPFALRRFARKLIDKSFPGEVRQRGAWEELYSSRIEMIFDVWVGKLVRTPRDVIRLWEAIKLGWPHLSGKADFADYLWLQVIKLKAPALYEWVRDYVSSIGSYRDSGRPGDTEAKSEATRLISILEGLGWGKDRDHSGLGQMLPGVGNFVANKPRVFDLVDGELAKFENERRLGSPSHWRLYFSFDVPSYALDDDTLLRFLRVAKEDAKDAAAILIELQSRPNKSKGFFLQILFERLFDRIESLNDDELVGIARTLAEVMDEIEEPINAGLGLVGPWRRALRLLRPPVAPHFVNIVRNGRSINWLASVIRDQGFAYGLPEGAEAREETRWLPRDDFDLALGIILGRFKIMGIEAITKTREPLTILFCWLQLGDAEELKRLIAEAVVSDQVFLSLLESMRSWVSSSDQGIYRNLDPKYVGYFLDVPTTKDRLLRLSRQESERELMQRAQEVIKGWNRTDWTADRIDG